MISDQSKYSFGEYLGHARLIERYEKFSSPYKHSRLPVKQPNLDECLQLQRHTIKPPIISYDDDAKAKHLFNIRDLIDPTIV